MVGAIRLWLTGMAVLVLATGGALAADKPDPKKKPTKKESKAAKDAKPVKWVLVNHDQFQVEDLVGTLTSCVYRVTQPGDTIVLDDEDRTQVKAIRKENEIEVQVFVNYEKLPQFSAEKLRAGLEAAIASCFSRIVEE